MLFTIASFYRFAVSAGLIVSNPVQLVERPKISTEHSATQSLTKAQARALLNAARTDNPRSHALVSLLLFTGIRVSEALDANITDYGQNTGHQTLTVQRKGGNLHRRLAREASDSSADP